MGSPFTGWPAFTIEIQTVTLPSKREGTSIDAMDEEGWEQEEEEEAILFAEHKQTQTT